jgi:hypothetical protein
MYRWLRTEGRSRSFVRPRATMRAVSAVETRNRKRPRPRRTSPSRSTREQLPWIDARDRVGDLIDDYLATRPADEMRAAVEHVEDGLRLGDSRGRLL